VLLDADHWYAVVMVWSNGRWLHYSLVSAPLVLVSLSLLWGLVATAPTVGWGNIETSPIVEPPLIEIPQMVAVARAEDVILRGRLT